MLIDFRTSDDAGVYRWDASSALVQSVDFLTPIVDDPFAYGQIAAANSLSDVYAMGAKPLTAMAIAGFPNEELDPSVVKSIFKGGLSKLHEAGVALIGGHTVQDAEVKFGYAVTGSVDPDRLLSNAGAQVGDTLLLTKPIGTGIIATAIKKGRAAKNIETAAIESMTTLNHASANALCTLARDEVHACTDVTGFGLLGHACEMASASNVTLRIESAAVPLLEGAVALARHNRTGGGYQRGALRPEDEVRSGTRWRDCNLTLRSTNIRRVAGRGDGHSGGSSGECVGGSWYPGGQDWHS